MPDHPSELELLAQATIRQRHPARHQPLRPGKVPTRTRAAASLRRLADLLDNA
ncbi:MAG: hypothetical protein WAW88_08675 [Nocardioides sp.]